MSESTDTQPPEDQNPPESEAQQPGDEQDGSQEPETPTEPVEGQDDTNQGGLDPAPEDPPPQSRPRQYDDTPAHELHHNAKRPVRFWMAAEDATEYEHIAVLEHAGWTDENVCTRRAYRKAFQEWIDASYQA